MSSLILGALAHVDAGKTTLCEAILYQTKTIRNLGRIDHQDSFLDYGSEERKRGITIYNKEARFSFNNKNYVYLDTPGHLDLKSEANRALKAIDVGLLIISGAEEISSVNITIFNNLLRYEIPIIIFVNKMDASPYKEEEILSNIQKRLSLQCTSLANLKEQIALEDESLLDDYLNNNLDKKEIVSALNLNKVIPVLFGSALKGQGIEELLHFIDEYYELKETNGLLSAYIYKISYEGNERLCHVKLHSGKLINKTSFQNEKINEIRLYSGESFVNVQEVVGNEICTLKGLNNLPIGTTLPSLFQEEIDQLPSLTYELITDSDSNEAYKILSVLNEENPQYRLSLQNNHLFINLSGELEKEILAKTILERFHLAISFSNPLIRYKETISNETIGVGHFEPLRHYAEVIVKLKPNKEGYKVRSLINNSYTGPLIQYLNHYRPKGILYNAPLDNIEITILDFKTHLKHTEGGDLIEALRRAIRQGLSKSENQLLEPYYLVNIDTNINTQNAIISKCSDLGLTFSIEENAILVKTALEQFNDFILSLRQKLKDNLSFEIVDMVYDNANHAKEIIEKRGYDYLKDLRNPAGSVFTFNGAGHYIPPENVEENMHLKMEDYCGANKNSFTFTLSKKVSEEELKRVWDSLYKPKERLFKKSNIDNDENKHIEINTKPIIYIIDGYNLLYKLSEQNKVDITNFIMAREKVIDLVSDFKGYVNAECILVFDAYKQDNIKPSINSDGPISIVYTKSGQTADTFIEEKTKELSKDYKVITVTSDYLEQLKILHNNGLRLSTDEFLSRYERFQKQGSKIDKTYSNKPLAEIRKLLIEE